MKKHLALFLFVLCVLGVKAQTKEELIKKIDKDIDALQMLRKMAGLRIEITAGSSKSFDPNDGFNFSKYSLAQPPGNREVLLDFFNKLPVHNNLQYPYNIVSINKKETDLKKLLGYDYTSFSNNPDQDARFTPKQLVFLDGTRITSNLPVITKESIAVKYKKTEKDDDGETYDYVDEVSMNELEKLVWKSSSFNEAMAVQSPKPLKSISYQITLPIPSKKTYELGAQQKTANTIYGTITLDTIAGNKVYCTIPDVEVNDAIQIEAYYKNGKVLDKKGSSSNTAVTEGKKKMYEQWLATLNAAKEEVSKSKIKNTKDLEAYFKEHAVQVDENEKKSYKTAVYTFAGPVSKLAFIVTDSISKVETFDITCELNYKDGEDEFIAIDFKGGKTGLLNKAGEWIVQPQFNEHFRPLNRYFYWDQYDDQQNTFRYDPVTKAIRKVDYRVADREIYNGKYVKVASRSNGPQGLVDARSGKFVLPIEYDFIQFKSGKFWQLEKGGKQGILDQNFQIVLPLIYERADAEGDYVFVRDGGYKKDIYDATGKNITNGKYDDINGTFSDGLLLVGKRHKSKEGYTSTKYYYIDSLCNVRIDVSAKGYHDPQEFSSGMAVVKNQGGDYGYMNTSGELVIPFQYKYARYFYRTSQLALVKLKSGTYVLINKEGKIAKELPGDFNQTKLRNEDRASRILMENRKSFNEYGEELEYEMGDYW